MSGRAFTGIGSPWRFAMSQRNTLPERPPTPAWRRIPRCGFEPTARFTVVRRYTAAFSPVRQISRCCRFRLFRTGCLMHILDSWSRHWIIASGFIGSSGWTSGSSMTRLHPRRTRAEASATGDSSPRVDFTWPPSCRKAWYGGWDDVRGRRSNGFFSVNGRTRRV